MQLVEQMSANQEASKAMENEQGGGLKGWRECQRHFEVERYEDSKSSKTRFVNKTKSVEMISSITESIPKSRDQVAIDKQLKKPGKRKVDSRGKSKK